LKEAWIHHVYYPDEFVEDAKFDDIISHGGACTLGLEPLATWQCSGIDVATWFNADFFLSFVH